MNNIESVKARLDNAIKWANENNVKIVSNRFGNRGAGCGCLLSCLAWSEGNDSEYVGSIDYNEMASSVNLPSEIVAGVLLGFDRAPIRKFCDKDAYALGDEYRIKLKL